MAEPALNFENLTASTEGLDLLFQNHQNQVEQIQIQDQDHLEQNVFQDLDPVELIPLVEAAKRLGITRRYVHKLVSSGRIQAIRDSKGHWFVKVEQGKIQIQDHLEPKAFHNQDHLEPHVPFQLPAEVVHGYQQQIRELQEKFDAAQHQLQGASFRTGYLESKVESLNNELQNQTETIKLLTDSQHNAGWWHRFSSWFIGR